MAPLSLMDIWPFALYAANVTHGPGSEKWDRLRLVAALSARHATIPGMADDVPIPREGKLTGWKHPRGVQKTGSRNSPDACPFCGTEVHPAPRVLLGQPSMGEIANPEPWQEIGKCRKCGAGLRRIPGDPWIGTSA